MVANMAVITMKHIDFSHVFAEPSYPSHEADGYPLEGIDDVPGSANAKQSLRLLPELHCWPPAAMSWTMQSSQLS